MASLLNQRQYVMYKLVGIASDTVRTYSKAPPVAGDYAMSRSSAAIPQSILRHFLRYWSQTVMA